MTSPATNLYSDKDTLLAAVLAAVQAYVEDEIHEPLVQRYTRPISAWKMAARQATTDARFQRQIYWKGRDKRSTTSLHTT